MSLLFFFFTYFNLGIEFKSTIPLEPDVDVAPGFFVAGHQEYWLRHGKTLELYQLNDSGEIVRTLRSPGGQGPGSFSMPRDFLYFDHGKSFLLLAGHGQTLVFDGKTFEFQREISKFIPYDFVFKWDDASFLFIFAQGQIKKLTDSAFVFNLDGEVLKSWNIKKRFQKAHEPHGYSNNGVLDAGHIFYEAEGAFPELHCYDLERNGKHEIWRLALPAYYREPPNKNIDRKYLFDQEKLWKYLEEFTQLEEMELMAGRFLSVAWRIWEPYDRSMDIYDTVTRERLVANVRVTGRLMDAYENRLYFLETADEGKASEHYLLHIYEFDHPHFQKTP